MPEKSGGQVFGEVLRARGVTAVFTLPGTQNQELLHRLKRAEIDCVLASSETAASMMANGYARASGRVGVVATIPGPGFMFALPGLAEAALDHTPVLHLVTKVAPRAGGKAPLQYLDMRAICEPFVKAVFTIEEAEVLKREIERAFDTALSFPQGPVLVEISDAALQLPVGKEHGTESGRAAPRVDPEELIGLLRQAEKPLLILGRDAVPFAAEVQEFLRRHPMPFMILPPARGVLDERSSWCVPCELTIGVTKQQQRFLDSADCLLTVGLGGDFNETGGYQLVLPADRWLALGYFCDGARAFIRPAESLGATLNAVSNALSGLEGVNGERWAPETLTDRFQNIRSEIEQSVVLPRVRGNEDPNAVATVLTSIGSTLCADSVVTIDSGLHQVLSRIFIKASTPRSLLFPTEFQSMGFALPAAIGALVSGRAKRAVAIVGDGGLWMSGFELATAASRGLPLTVVVLNDSSYGLIRRQQLERFGEETLVDLPAIDWNAFASAVRCDYFSVSRSEQLPAIFQSAGVQLVEIPLEENEHFGKLAEKVRKRERLERYLGPRIAGALRRIKRLV